MPVYYNADKKTWYAMFYAKDYKGVNKKYKKTGFKKKKEAQEYEYEFKKKIAKSCMNFILRIIVKDINRLLLILSKLFLNYIYCHFLEMLKLIRLLRI